MEKYIIILIFIVILYFLFFYNSCNTIEKADNTSAYDIDVKLAESIIKLDQLAKDTQNPAGITLPASLVVHVDADISGTLNVNGTINFLPKGCIIAWSGLLTKIPYGWEICDGSNGKPNLTGRFIVGAGKTYGDISASDLLYGSFDGEQQHKLTVAEMPKHNHDIYINNMGGWGSDQREMVGKNPASGEYTSFAGGDQYHNNMPPYYVLYWIIKTI